MITKNYTFNKDYFFEVDNWLEKAGNEITRVTIKVEGSHAEYKITFKSYKFFWPFENFCTKYREQQREKIEKWRAERKPKVKVRG